MSHAVHEKPRRIFGDDCEECVDRATDIMKFGSIDAQNLRHLAALARALVDADSTGDPRPPNLSHADTKAIDLLRYVGRLVYRSGLTEATAEGRREGEAF